MVQIIITVVIALSSLVSCCPLVEAKSMRSVKVSVLQSECPVENLKTYIAYLRKELAKFWKPPSDSIKHSVVIAFSIHPGGEFSDLRVEKTSRLSAFDQSVLKSAPQCKFEPPPKCGDCIKVKAAFDFEP